MSKKIVITGGLGYIGMELSLLLSGESRIHDIKVLDNCFFSERVSQLKRWGIDYSQVDILDTSKLKEEISDADIIFHLAGITNVGTTLEDKDLKRDKKIRNVGVNGTRNIIKFSKSTTKIIFPSTHVVYEGLKKQKKEIKESFLPNPTLEYAKGKFQSENDLISSKKNFVILRLGSVFGNSFDSTRLNIMPNLFSKISAIDGTIKLYGKGSQLKSLVSVKDVARAMKFFADNNEINYEIFNCVGENMTVKEVADICKKYNKDLKTISTNDPIPNNGYTLSNEKIKKAGFKFLYKLDKSIEEMIQEWRNQKIINTNEEIKIGENNFVDERGIISNYYFQDNLNMIGYVESISGSIRGNHYHPVQTQKCLLVKGKYISITKDLLDPNSVIETRLVDEGDLSTIPPNVAHTMVFIEDSIFLNLVNGERDHKNYGMTHTMKYDLVSEKVGKLLIDSYKTECRVCGGGLNHYLSLGFSPLANNLNSLKNEINEEYPLDLNFCKKCFNSQLSVAVPAKKMFNNYLYLSSTSQQFRNHFSKIATEIKNQLKHNKNSFVVDIGSNDGIFLKPLKEQGIKSIGIEPAKNVAKIANSNNLTTLPEYFNENSVKKIIKKYGKADVITAFNVFAHNDNLKQMLNNVETLLKKDGEFIFEIQYLLRTIKDLTFDNVYHEHVNYWCLLSLLQFFKGSKLEIYKVKEVDTHGGSLRVYATMNKNKKTHKSVAEYIDLEKKNKLDRLETYLKFANDVKNVKFKSLSRIKNILSEDKKIIGFGAPAKATTILNFFGMSNNHFSFTVDDNILKHGKYIPGTNIQIKSRQDIDPNKYDYVLVLAWNFFDQIKKSNMKYFSKSDFIKLK